MSVGKRVRAQKRSCDEFDLRRLRAFDKAMLAAQPQNAIESRPTRFVERAEYFVDVRLRWDGDFWQVADETYARTFSCDKTTLKSAVLEICADLHVFVPACVHLHAVVTNTVSKQEKNLFLSTVRIADMSDEFVLPSNYVVTFASQLCAIM